MQQSQLRYSTQWQDAQLDHMKSGTSSHVPFAGPQPGAFWASSQEAPSYAPERRPLLLTASPPQQRHAANQLHQPLSSTHQLYCHESTGHPEQSRNEQGGRWQGHAPPGWASGQLRGYRGEGDASLASSFDSSAGQLPSKREGTLHLAPENRGNVAGVPAGFEMREPGVGIQKQRGSGGNECRQAMDTVPHPPRTPRDITNGGRAAKPYATEESLEVRTKAEDSTMVTTVNKKSGALVI
jgi:hypothetical protein